MGIPPIKIGDFCHLLGYKRHLIDIIASADETDLWRNSNESWRLMRRAAEGFSAARLRGRDCYHTAKDICIDGLFTDLIAHFTHLLHPDFDFRKNSQDNEFGLLARVGLEPDFMANGSWLEMKISRTEIDGLRRANWTGQTFTLRPGQVKRQLLDYDGYSPLLFLRINYEDKKFAVIKRSDFVPSRANDGSWFARIRPIGIEPDMGAFVNSLHAELLRATAR